MKFQYLQRAAAAGAAIVMLATMSACSGDGSTGDSSFDGPEGLAKPGSSIPAVNVKAGLSPYADELIMAAGITRGYLKDVGVTVGPGEFGAKTDLIAALTPLLNKQIELGSGYAPAIVSQLDNVDNVVMFGIQDVFYGYRILAPEGKYETLKDFMGKGDSYEEGLTNVLAQLKGEKVILRDGVVPTFYNLIAGSGKTAMKDWKVSYLANPDIVRAAQSGKADFVSPTGAVEISRLQMDGWEPLVELREVIENMPEDATVSLRSTFSGYLTTREYAEKNFDTLLRITSVMYRLIDELEKDPEGTVADYVDYVNSTTGSSLTAKELAATFDGLYSVRNFEDAADFFTDKESPFYFETVAAGQIDELAEKGVIKDGHGPEDLSIAKEVYEALVKYRAEADSALKDAPDGDLKDRAQAQYDARNYLDAYRLAAAAKESE